MSSLVVEVSADGGTNWTSVWEKLTLNGVDRPPCSGSRLAIRWGQLRSSTWLDSIHA